MEPKGIIYAARSIYVTTHAYAHTENVNEYVVRRDARKLDRLCAIGDVIYSKNFISSTHHYTQKETKQNTVLMKKIETSALHYTHFVSS